MATLNANIKTFDQLVALLNTLLNGDATTSGTTDAGSAPSWNKHIADMAQQVADLVAANGGVAYETKAELAADLAHAAGTIGLVYDDGSNTGTYVKQGGSGSGSWVLRDEARVTTLESRATVLETDVATIEVAVEQAGWSRSGYHFVVQDQDGRSPLAIDTSGGIWFADLNASLALTTLSDYLLDDWPARSGRAFAVLDTADREAIAVLSDGSVLVGGADLSAHMAAQDTHANGTATIAGWGDSMTNPWMTRFALLAPERTLFQGGIGGQRSYHIAARQGGMTALFSAASNTIPASGGVTLTPDGIDFLSYAWDLSRTGYFCGIHGTLFRDGSTGVYTFTRTLAGSAVFVPPSTPWISDEAITHRESVNVLWVGRNNYYTGRPDGELDDANTEIKDAYARMIASLVPYRPRYLIIGICNQDRSDEYAGTARHTKMLELNESLADLYQDRFIDVRAHLVNAYDSGDPDDVIDFGNDVPPGTLRDGDLHLNDAGNDIVAQLILARLNLKGW